MQVERDLVCRICGVVVDHHVCEEAYKDMGMLTAMLMTDSMVDHREETGCPGNNGWIESPWQEVPESAGTADGMSTNDRC